MIRRMMITGMCVAFFSTLATAAGEVTFSYKFEKGVAQHYRLQINTEMEMQGMEASQMADMTVTVTCQEAKADQNAMTLVFEKVEASNVIAGNMQPDPLAAQMVGKTVNFVVDSHGTVTAITPGAGFDAWQQVQPVVEPTLKNWYVYLPAKAVAVGGEWKRDNFKDRTAAGSEYVSNEHFKFREMKKDKGKDVAVVDEDVTTTVGGSTETPVGVFNVSGTGKGKFEFNFDTARGAISYFKGTMDTNIDMTPQSGGDPMKTSVANHIERQLLE